MKRLLVLLLALSAFLTACSDDGKKDSVKGSSCTAAGKGTTDLTKKPEPAFLKDPEPVKTTTHDIVCGDGEAAEDGDKVEVKYVGLLYKDGKEFDSSWQRGPEETLPFTIGGGVIAGFSKGVTGMKVGGRREILIPASDGYGEQTNGPIPGGSTLVFVVDLVKIVPPPAETPCTPSGKGSTDLDKKPVVTVPDGPAPQTTTFTDIVCGKGTQANDGDHVEVKYVGVLFKDGKEFDSSWKRGASQTLPFDIGGQVIPGFSKGVAGMKIGGRRQIVIPPSEGYGNTANGGIPAGSTLVFVVDLVKVG